MRGPDDCWEWTGWNNGAGYGAIGKGQKSYLATRWAYYIEHGDDPGDECVCHTCDNPGCVNPAHLWLGTIGDNNRDAWQKGRSFQPETLPGEQNTQAKLTEQDVREIRKSNELQRILAEQYGVCHQLISQIKTGKIWKHVA